MAKYKPFSRRKLNRGFQAWARKNWAIFAVVIAGTLGIVAVTTYMAAELFPRCAFTWWLLGSSRQGPSR